MPTTPVLPDDQMRELGFTDHRPTHWYFSRRIGFEDFFSVTIDKATGEYEELTYDTMFGQPAYYGQMVEPHRSRYRTAIDRAVAELNAAGLTVAVNHTEYGWPDGSEPLNVEALDALVAEVTKAVVPESLGAKRRRDMEAGIDAALTHLFAEDRIVPAGATLRQEWHSVLIDEHGDDWDEVPAASRAEAEQHIADWMAEETNSLPEDTRLTIRSRWTLDSTWAEVSK